MATSFVGCKLPHGLQIRIGAKAEKAPVNDYRDAHLIITEEGKTITLAGSNARDSDGLPASVGGYGFTRVDTDVITGWLEANRDFAPVKNGFIFIEKDLASAKAHAREMAGEKTGFERLDYENPMGDGTVAPTKTLEQARQDAADQQAAARG